MFTSDIKQKALSLGYSACGIIPAGVFDFYTEALDIRIKSFPESERLYMPLYGMAQLPEDARSVIVCTRGYSSYRVPENLHELYGKVYLFDGRLDYTQEHMIKNEFEAFLKMHGMSIIKCPVPARLAAAKAGAGKFGRNNFIYDPVHGSYIWIETWVIDRELDYDEVKDDIYMSSCSDSCNRCIEACPTKALSGSFSMNMGRCITRLTTQQGDVPDDGTKNSMGRWLYGCDLCQDACPMNKGRFSGQKEFPMLDEYEEYMSCERILEMDEKTYLDVIYPRFWYAGEDGLWLWKCSALRSIVNTGDREHFNLVKKYCDHEETHIRETARWGCKILGL